MKRNRIWRLLRRTFMEYYADRAHLFASGVSYYALISIAPILVISITIARWLLGEDSARQQIIEQFTEWWGPGARQFLEQSYRRLRYTSSGLFPTIASIAVVVWGATRTFVTLSTALDVIWRAGPGAGESWSEMFFDRIVAFAVALGTGFLLVLLTLFSMGLSLLRPYLGQQVFFAPVFQSIYWIASCAILTLLCAVIYHVLPHVDVAWKHVWIGAFVTALLLSIARSLISWYFSYAGTQSVYGAAGSVMVILIGVYYSAQVFFMGAEFTHVYARMGGMKKKLGSPNVKQAGEAVH